MRRLAIRPGGIGDFILSLPALERLRTEYFEVWTLARNSPLVRFADRVRSIASTGLDLMGVVDPPPALIEELRGFDSIVSWYGANRPEFRETTAALRLPFTFFPALPPSDVATSARRPLLIHAADFYMEQARTVTNVVGGFAYQAPAGDLKVAGRRHRLPHQRSDGDSPALPYAIPRIQCETTLGNYAVIHPFSGSRAKDWPLEKYRALAARLGRIMPVKWCSGPEDPPLPDAVRIEDLYALACWLAGARLYIGNDSGITHLAAAAGAPVLALFGPTDPAVWAPRGPNVRVATWKAPGIY